MQTDIVTLCHSALTAGNQLSVLGAFNIIYAPSLPHRFPPFTVAVRARFDDTEHGNHRLRLTVLDTDGRILGEAFVDRFHLAEIPAASPLSKESFHQTATLCITFPITGMELKSYGEHAIDLALDEQPVLRTPFYVYPPQNA